MAKKVIIWICAAILGAVPAAAYQAAADDARAGTWIGTWQADASNGGFELTLEKGKEGPLTGRVSVTGEPTYKATLKTLTIEGDKLTASYDFPLADGVEVRLAGTFDGTACKGTWVVRETANATTAAQGTWSVTKKQVQ